MSCKYCGKYAVIIVALGVLPQYQGSGVGRSLIEKIENANKVKGNMKKKKDCSEN